MAVVDNGFFPISDLMENTTISHGVGSFSNSLDDHGNRVAGLVAARGNDSSHVTGIMWRADLRLYDFHVSPTGAHVAGQEAELWSTMMRAAMEGARVINISIGMSWEEMRNVPYDPDLETRPAFLAANKHLVATWFAGFRTRMDTLAARNIHPLVVFSAGNESIGAEWNMARIAADTFPDQVIVVGGSTAANALGSLSNRGRLVQIVAPGEDVYVLRGDSTVVKGPPGSGTSFAAPLVTGAAGLLLSFDSTLTAGELKEAIIQGAIRGGRTAGGIPLLNVHESLKYVAERPGAPLCGNRLWVDGTSLVAARGSATPTPLFQVGDAPGSFQALHGGRQVRFYDYMLGSDRLFQWSAAGWAERTIPGTQSDSVFGPRNEGPVYRGYRGVSHNADSVAYTTSSATGFTVMVADTVTWNWQTRADIPVARNQSQPNTCIRRYTGDTITAPSCIDSAGVGTVHSDGFSLPAYSPRGDRVYVSVPRTTTTGSTSGSWVICPGQNLSKLPMNHQECIGTSGTTSWASSTIYRVNAHAQGYAVFKTVSGHVDEITPGDGGQEMTVHATTYTITCTGTWVFENGRLGMQSSCAPVVPSCTVQFWHERSGNTLATSPVVCNNAVTFAPVRAAGVGTATARGSRSPTRQPLPGPGAWLTGSARVLGTTRG